MDDTILQVLHCTMNCEFNPRSGAFWRVSEISLQIGQARPVTSMVKLSMLTSWLLVEFGVPVVHGTSPMLLISHSFLADAGMKRSSLINYNEQNEEKKQCIGLSQGDNNSRTRNWLQSSIFWTTDKTSLCLTEGHKMLPSHTILGSSWQFFVFTSDWSQAVQCEITTPGVTDRKQW